MGACFVRLSKISEGLGADKWRFALWYAPFFLTLAELSFSAPPASCFHPFCIYTAHTRQNMALENTATAGHDFGPAAESAEALELRAVDTRVEAGDKDGDEQLLPAGEYLSGFKLYGVFSALLLSMFLVSPCMILLIRLHGLIGASGSLGHGK